MANPATEKSFLYARLIGRISLFFVVASLNIVYPADDGVQKSFISGKPIGDIAVSGRLDIELHAKFMASRTFDNDTVLNWYNLGYSGGGNNPVGGTFGNFGLHYPHQERDEKYPEWEENEGVPAVSFDGNDAMRGDFPAEKNVVDSNSAAVEVWALNESPSKGEIILGWESEDSHKTSAPMQWPPVLDGTKKWRHIVVNLNDNTETWYIDSRKAREMQREMIIKEGHHLVLGGASMNSPSFSGSLAAVRIHNKPLNKEQIQHNFEGGPMLGTELKINFDPEKSSGSDYHAEAWGKPDSKNFHSEKSEHFRARVHRKIFNDKWDKKRRNRYLKQIADAFKLAEDTYDVLAHRMARRVGIVSAKPKYRGDGIKYKIPIQATDGGNYMGWHGKLGIGYGCQGRGHFNPHEFVHGTQAQTGKGIIGHYWEVDANFPQTYTGIYQTKPPDVIYKTSQFYEAHGSDYYHSRSTFEHLAQTPEYGPMFISKLWYEGKDNEYPWIKFQRYDPDPATDIAYELGRMAQKNVTLDYKIFSGHRNQPKDLYKQALKKRREQIVRYGHVLLKEIPYEPGWYRPAKEDAPQQTGWNIVPLEITSDNVSMRLSGYINPERGSNWRAGFVAVNAEGEPRYSDLVEYGERLDFELQERDNELFLTVAGTPDKFERIALTQNFRSPAAEQFVYKVALKGAKPKDTLWAYYDEKYTFEDISGHRHPKGGGFVADSAEVDESVYIGSDARVLGDSRISGKVKVGGHAIIHNSDLQDRATVSGKSVVVKSTVKGHAVVSGHALVEKSTIKDYGRVRDSAKVSGTKISDFAKLAGHASTNSPVGDRAVVKGYARVYGGSVKGNAMVDGSYAKGNELTKGKWFQWSWGKGKENGEVDKDFNDLYLDMSFDKNHPWMAWDDFGLTWGYKVNGVSSVSCEDRGRVLKLNGTNQFVELPGDVVDQIDMILKISAKWAGGEAGQPVFDFGINPGNNIWFTPANKEGKAELTFNLKGYRKTITASRALPKNEWCEVVVASAHDKGARLYINGKLIGGNKDITLPRLTWRVNEFSNFLGRSQSGDSFLNGMLDNFKVYSSISQLKKVTQQDLE